MKLLVSGTTVSVARLASRWSDRLGHLITPANRNSMGALLSTELSWAADNGCYNGLDETRFRRLLGKIKGHERCLFVVCPDKVTDARTTLNLFDEWREELIACNQPIAFVGQDGAEDCDIPWGLFDAWFIGGSTEWKLSRCSAELGIEAKKRGKWVHMGRVNSFKRILIAYDMGCDSVDGSSMSMFGDRWVHKFCAYADGLMRQRQLFANEEAAVKARQEGS